MNTRTLCETNEKLNKIEEGDEYMGAWGVKSFENDSALDFITELEDEKDLTIIVFKFSEFISASEEEEIIDSDMATEVLAAAEIVSVLLGNLSDEVPKKIYKWIEKKRNYDRKIISLFNEIINEGDFDNEFINTWNNYTKDQKWKYILNYLSETAIKSIEIVDVRSELKELW